MGPELTTELLEKLWRAVRFGEYKIKGQVAERIVVADPVQFGLRVRINRNDPISFWVRFKLGEPPVEATHEMPRRMVVIVPDEADIPNDQMKLGELPKMSIESARRLAAAVRLLAGEGVDPVKALAEHL